MRFFDVDDCSFTIKKWEVLQIKLAIVLMRFIMKDGAVINKNGILFINK
ncbi:hypothetical protein XSR1_80049 [Xenorhabdus szentirmaii DSM 16338]|uniref:Uncharacterized protein n=1 Tax=Xenorhabdus szentirmaii DSM 16338 TaxID=1427518 RepID=W1J4A2_9GAMM|nr:hypothetical protein XSR1_80049 [Xenorhabdus szentirmaii DSM 16338]